MAKHDSLASQPLVPAFGLSAEDFLQAGFRFDPGDRLLIDTSVLIGYLYTGDPWHRLAKWLFDQAILVPHAPRLFIMHRIQGEFAHRASEDALRTLTRSPARVSAARAQALQSLAGIMGSYPLIGLFPSTETVMKEWGQLYQLLPFDETDALQLATCKVYGFCLLTFDKRLVRIAVGARDNLTRLGYDFRIYYTPDPAVALPASATATPTAKAP